MLIMAQEELEFEDALQCIKYFRVNKNYIKKDVEDYMVVYHMLSKHSILNMDVVAHHRFHQAVKEIEAHETESSSFAIQAVDPFLSLDYARMLLREYDTQSLAWGHTILGLVKEVTIAKEEPALMTWLVESLSKNNQYYPLRNMIDAQMEQKLDEKTVYDCVMKSRKLL